MDEIEIALGIVGRVKVLAKLAVDPEKWFSLYSLAKETKLDRTKLSRTMPHLVCSGWVEIFQADDGSGIRKYRLNPSSDNAQRFASFLHESGYYFRE